MKSANILGIYFDNTTLSGAVETTIAQLRAGKKGYVVTPNSEIVYMAREDRAFATLLNQATQVLPDGIGVIYAAKILGQKLSGKVAGVDYADALLARMAQEGMSLFILGAKPGVAEQAAQNLVQKHAGLRIAGVADGYFKSDADAIAQIEAAGGADVLFVCLGAVRQEKFMAEHLHEMPVTIACGLGGSVDVFAGTVQRAPDIFVKLGLEWFYRLIKEPWRAKRMAKLPLFMLVVLRTRLFGTK